MSVADESFMLLSLKEKESKKLAQVIGSDTCRKILDFLTTKDFTTETNAAKELKIPMSTIHYNFKALIESRLVIADEFHYSDKGKEVPHYKLAKKFIIIAPSDEKNVFDKLKKFWPITAIVIGVAAVLEFGKQFFSKAPSLAINSASFAMDAAPKAMMDEVIEEAIPEVMSMGARAVTDDAAPIIIEEVTRQFPSLLTMWFLGGALFVILAMVVWEFVKKE